MYSTSIYVLLPGSLKLALARTFPRNPSSFWNQAAPGWDPAAAPACLWFNARYRWLVCGWVVRKPPIALTPSWYTLLRNQGISGGCLYKPRLSPRTRCNGLIPLDSKGILVFLRPPCFHASCQASGGVTEIRWELRCGPWV